LPRLGLGLILRSSPFVLLPTLKSSTELGFAVFSRYWKQVKVQGLNDDSISGKQFTFITIQRDIIMAEYFSRKEGNRKAKKRIFVNFPMPSIRRFLF
jgi:hypothetical protein